MNYPFEIEMDTSDYALGAVITQLGHAVMFQFDTLNDTVRRYLAYEK